MNKLLNKQTDLQAQHSLYCLWWTLPLFQLQKKYMFSDFALLRH